MDTSLQLYKGKLKEAISLVSDMNQEKKQEAVRCWNDFAVQLQEIFHDNHYSHGQPIGHHASDSIYGSQTTTSNATSHDETSNALDNISNALSSTDTSNLLETTSLKQANPRSMATHFHQDNNIQKNLSGRSYITAQQTATTLHSLSPGKVSSVIVGGKINNAVIDTVPTTIPTYAVAHSIDISNNNSTIANHSVDPTSVQSSYGLVKQHPGLVTHTNTTSKPIVSVSNSMGDELYCSSIDVSHSTNSSHTAINYLTTNQAPVFTNASIGKHDHSSISNDDAYGRLVVPVTRANYSDEVGNGQFDRGPKMFDETLAGLEHFDQRVASLGAVLDNVGVVTPASRSETFTQSEKPLQQIQLFRSNNDYSSSNSHYSVPSKAIKNIYYSSINDDQTNQAGDSNCPAQIQSGGEKESFISSPGESGGDSTSTSNSQQCDVKKEQAKDKNLDVTSKHSPSNQHTCEICGKSGFSTKGNLKRHLRAHSGEKPFKCEYCDSSFTEKKSLKIHVRRHTGEKPYKCEICGKLFSQTGVLQSHMALHLNERKFDCQKCGKAFRQRSQLKLHLMRHEGVKRLECSTCMAKFLTKGDLERHCRIHTGERPYACKICSKTFTRQQSLNEHMNRHTGRKPYDCKFCDKTFSEMSACYKHAKTHTKQDQTQQQESRAHLRQAADPSKNTP